MTVAHAHSIGVLGCDSQYVRPIDGVDLRIWILLSDKDPEDPMARGNIEHFQGAVFLESKIVRDSHCGRIH